MGKYFNKIGKPVLPSLDFSKRKALLKAGISICSVEPATFSVSNLLRQYYTVVVVVVVVVSVSLK